MSQWHYKNKVNIRLKYCSCVWPGNIAGNFPQYSLKVRHLCFLIPIIIPFNSTNASEKKKTLIDGFIIWGFFLTKVQNLFLNPILHGLFWAGWSRWGGGGMESTTPL